MSTLSSRASGKVAGPRASESDSPALREGVMGREAGAAAGGGGPVRSSLCALRPRSTESKERCEAEKEADRGDSGGCRRSGTRCGR